MEKKIIAANWKMQKTNKEAEEFFKEYKKLVDKKSLHQAIFCVPYTTIPTAVKYAKDLNFVVGAENVAWAKNGTFTGEISTDMLLEVGVEAVIIGHSERRELFNETPKTINARLKAALDAGLIGIMCINETAEEFEKGTTDASIKEQMDVCLKDIAYSDKLMIAYEPIFAISGGDPTKPKPIPTKEKIEHVHGLIDKIAKEKYGKRVPILYGGSANDKNAPELFLMKNVDGALVGGASLVPEKFATMMNVK